MAHAEKDTIITTKVVVHLTLSIQEAETLKKVCARIGGDYENSPREHMAAISDALDSAGIDTVDLKVKHGMMDAIYFADYEKAL